MMWSNHGGWGWSDWLAMSLLMLVFWGLFIALVVWLTRIIAPGSPGGPLADGPPKDRNSDEILAERFARGDIDADEYARRREILHGSP